MEGTRYWMANDGSIVRQWTQEEYSTLNENSIIEESLPYKVCMYCGSPYSWKTHKNIVYLDDSEETICAICERKRIKKKINNGYKYCTAKLRCFETGYKNGVYYQTRW